VLNLGVIILAGGLSSRMGYPKALLPWTNGESLISHALRNALEHDANDILISIGDDESLGLILSTHCRIKKKKKFLSFGILFLGVVH